MVIGIDCRRLKKNRTGVGNYIYEIIKRLNNIDDNNEYVLYSNDEIFIDFKLNNNWKIKIDKSRIGTFWLYYKLPQIIYNDNIDVFWGTEHILPKRNKYTRNIKFVVTIHDLAIQIIKNVGSYYNTIIQKLFLKKSIYNADKIIAISKSTKKDIIDLYGIDDNKISVIYNSNSNNLKSSLANMNIEEKFGIKPKKYFLFLSTIEPRKNIETIIKGFNKFCETNNDIKLVLTGGIGWKSKKTMKAIEKSLVKDRIILTGFVTASEKETLLNEAIALLFPSIYEGFGLPILEAYSHQLPVITTNVSSIPEVAGPAGIYISNPYDYEDLCHCMFKVLSLKDDEYKKILYNIKIQLDKFDWNISANKIIEVFKEFNG